MIGRRTGFPHAQPASSPKAAGATSEKLMPTHPPSRSTLFEEVSRRVHETSSSSWDAREGLENGGDISKARTGVEDGGRDGPAGGQSNSQQPSLLFSPGPPATTRLDPLLGPFPSSAFLRLAFPTNPFPPPSLSLSSFCRDEGALRPITRSFQQIKFGGVAEF